MGTPERSALEAQLFDALCALDAARLVAPTTDQASLAELERLFDVQLASRHCDLAARWLRGQAKGYYTIGSAGHESNAAVAMALRPTDPALLHYRSGGFYLARAGLGGVHDILAGMVAATDEPIAGGRHKVFGRHDLAVIPQTSTIASHLPRAKRASISGRPASQPATTVSASSQALMLTNCSNTPCQKVT